MERRRKTLLLSILTLCICTALVVGGTYALFTDEATVNNHLQAGNLKVGLYRTAYTENVLDDEGYLETTVVHAQNDKIDSDDKNLEEELWLFNVNNAVPQSYYEADLDVLNQGSVAFSYGMRIDLTAGADTALVNQIKITVTYGTNETWFMLSDYAANSIDLGVLTTGQSGRFTVKAEFVDDVGEEFVNNNAMDETVEFFVQVYATQKVSK